MRVYREGSSVAWECALLEGSNGSRGTVDVEGGGGWDGG